MAWVCIFNIWRFTCLSPCGKATITWQDAQDEIKAQSLLTTTLIFFSSCLVISVWSIYCKSKLASDILIILIMLIKVYCKCQCIQRQIFCEADKAHWTLMSHLLCVCVFVVELMESLTNWENVTSGITWQKLVWWTRTASWHSQGLFRSLEAWLQRKPELTASPHG